MRTHALPSAPAQRQAWWFVAFVAVLVALPLPFGGNRPWASDVFAALCAAMLLGLAWDFYRLRENWPTGAPLYRLATSAALLALVALWAVAQTLEWTPATWHHPLWQSVRAMPNAASGAVSLDPDRFAESLARVLAYAACFLLAFFAGRDATRALRLVKALAIAAAVYALYGLIVQSTGAATILWYDKWAYRELLTSTFVNKNSYATYAALGLQCCIALLWHRLKHRPNDALPPDSALAAQLERFGKRDIFYVLMGLIVLGALVFTGSRAGVASGGAGCFALLLLLAVNRRWGWARWLPLVAVGVALTLGFMSLGNMATINRLDETQVEADAAARLAAYDIASDAIAEQPLRGYGLGGFENAFRLFRNPSLDLWFQHAHNDYLELMVELGVPAALMLLAAIALLLSCCAFGVWRRKRQEIFCILALSATVTVGLHALADFSMQIPAVAATYAALLGLGVAQSWSTREKGHD